MDWKGLSCRFKREGTGYGQLIKEQRMVLLENDPDGPGNRLWQLREEQRKVLIKDGPDGLKPAIAA